ncbi:MAG: TPM domain-containing protein [Candidatus Eremiobacteraeota bacterium]|nr:TPM domain-containing protein [Candidatus Eremiobacteraeota bacterium]MBV8366081.1 TPM domain-containing protein [Candidatus Eremiobacteraeota bacterium]
MAEDVHPLARHVDQHRIREAIGDAEQATTGKIYVTIAPHFWGDVHGGARRAFANLQRAHPMHENGVLFFVVPSRRTVRVLGGAGIHAKVGQQFWDEIAKEVAQRARDRDLTAGLVHGIARAGDALREQYPRERPH